MKPTVRTLLSAVSAILVLYLLWNLASDSDDGRRESHHRHHGQPGLAQHDRPQAGLYPDLSAAYEASDLMPEKMIVMSRLKRENTSWVDRELPEWANKIYVADDPDSPDGLARNKGREGNGYLRFIIDNYHSLPETVAFMHSHRAGLPKGWHIDNFAHDNALSLRLLRIQHIQEVGFANLRCTFDPGCPVGADLRGGPAAAVSMFEQQLPEAWPHLFPDKPLPDILSSPCCAQFAVARWKILERPRSDYERIWKWLMNVDLDDWTAGRILEYTWHVIFGQNAVYCRNLVQCYCDMYGLCD